MDNVQDAISLLRSLTPDDRLKVMRGLHCLDRDERINLALEVSNGLRLPEQLGGMDW